MKKFSFELEKILEFRNFEKQEAEAELAKALSKESEIKSNLEMIAKQMIISNQSLDKSSSFEDVKEELLQELTQANLVTEEKRSVLAECMKKTIALEKMKEKRKDEWRVASDYEEADAMDEASNHLKSYK